MVFRPACLDWVPPPEKGRDCLFVVSEVQQAEPCAVRRERQRADRRLDMSDIDHVLILQPLPASGLDGWTLSRPNVRCGLPPRAAGLTTSPDIGVADSLALLIELFRPFERTIHDRRRRAFQSQERDRVASGGGPTLQPVFEYEAFDAQ